MAAVETHNFQTEVQQPLHLMIHSLYSNKEIFLRELISNASDALDKYRFQELTSRGLKESIHEPRIVISAFEKSRRLIIEDNGIGMTKEELISHLGTIAKSGTKKFLEQLKEEDRKNSNLIGQFGVGFYSIFMVADKVTVDTCSALTGEACLWESAGQGEFTVAPSRRNERGTSIELTLKEDAQEFLQSWRIKEIVKKYSDYVTYPILFLGEDNNTEQINKTTPLWVKNKKENKPEDYNEFYKQNFKDYDIPLCYEHLHVEGLIPFYALLFVSSHAPHNLYERSEYGLQLYVKRVSIAQNFKQLLPEYLRFVTGVVETDELPLNVSREILQENNKISVIRKQITKKLLNQFLEISKNDIEKYSKFYNLFGQVLKEGFHFDAENHETLAELVRFKSSRTGEEGFVSLKDYLDRKASQQNEIYYIQTPSYEVAMRSPHLESFLERDIEVLFLVDPIDEWFVMDFPKYKEIHFKSISKGDLDLRGIGKEPIESNTKDNDPEQESLKPLLDFAEKQLSSYVKNVRWSKRLTESPCCLISDEHALSSHMERMLRASQQNIPVAKKTLELNPNHPLIKKLFKLKEQAQSEHELSEWIETLYDTALFAEGSPVREPGTYAKRLIQIMKKAADSI